jgi:peroxiredoxin
MAIEIGDRIPDVTLRTVREGKVRSVSTAELFRGKLGILFAVPGAFTSVCSDFHLPGYIELAETFHGKGVEVVACMSVNDIEVMKAWFEAKGVSEALQPLADGNAELTKGLGLELDATAFGMGIRSQRFAAILDDGVVRVLGIDEPGEVASSSAAAMLVELNEMKGAEPV